jgi:hypothetical protein
MLRIPDLPLPAGARTQLEAYQAEVDAALTYAERVSEAKRLFERRNTKSNPTFSVVRQVLDQMCSGARRCMYCEDSVADEVEHFKPKDFYPELVFTWANYLYSCGPCNSGKSNKFPIVSALSGEIVHLSRSRGAPVIPPEAGEAVLLDLRNEEPLDYLQLDLQDTFYFQPVSADGNSIEYQRAEQIIRILRLNAHDYLRRARAEAFGSYSARLFEYIYKRDLGFEPSKLELLKHAIKRMGHPTVWVEMKRQHQRLPQLRDLFDQAPEALGW